MSVETVLNIRNRNLEKRCANQLLNNQASGISTTTLACAQTSAIFLGFKGLEYVCAQPGRGGGGGGTKLFGTLGGVGGEGPQATTIHECDVLPLSKYYQIYIDLKGKTATVPVRL